MLSRKQAVYVTPAIADRVFRFENDSSTPPVVTVENLDGAVSVSIKYQESDDGTTWTDIVGTSATINPNSGNVQSVVSTRRLIALNAGNTVRINVEVARQLNGSPADLGGSI